MSDRPNLESLHEIGESITNAATAWAGAEDYVARGLTEWVRRTVADDRNHAVRAALAAIELVAGDYPTAPGSGVQAPKQYIDDMIATIKTWSANPSNNNKESVRSALDVTRQQHAWQSPDTQSHFWILEAVDHASLAVWSGERLSYIVPIDFSTSAARSITCSYHALVAGGTPAEGAAARIIDVVTQTK